MHSSSDEDDYSDSEFNYDGDDGDMEIDGDNAEIGSFIVIDGKNNIFPLNEIKNKINPASACKIYNCNGKHNTGYHFSLNSCPKYTQIRRNNGDFNIPDKIIFHKKNLIPNFKYFMRGKVVVIV